MRTGQRHAAAGLLLIVAVFVVAGCAAGTVAAPLPTVTPASTASARISVGVVGDSLSVGSGTDSLPQDPGSWVEYLGPDIVLAGGWRRDAAETGAMAANLRPFVADALVIMAGTNDVLQGVDPEDTVANIEKVSEKASVGVVVLCAIPPSLPAPERATRLNEHLQQLAQERGWSWVDPWIPERDGDGWKAGASPDGTHGTLTTYAKVGEVITQVVSREASHARG
ncbi:MAG: hypothetical protein JWR33_713 [Naasia sp.]|jgi:lysophospholipase L1-like esterase|uniref:SGNH/GDSL hydrolase family protein n=1 Tax=Naasia sp. TaxID=2546198 RepID=UPI002637EEAA|nr:GDSL-type esterase/lipase family protein [Naasia sp.]MCU1569972.1 hypothetical protein [Naasia sp.]